MVGVRFSAMEEESSGAVGFSEDLKHGCPQKGAVLDALGAELLGDDPAPDD